jgi:biopolymer transport protein ExbD
MAGGGGGSESGEPEFQVAPMIDVLLTILVFFMTITSAQVLKVDKTIQLPIAKDAQKKDNTRAEAILNVRWKLPEKKALFVFDDRTFSKATEMVGLIKNARITGEKKVTAGANPTFRAVIRGDRDVPAIYVSQAMNACAEAGITDISFSAVNKE